MDLWRALIIWRRERFRFERYLPFAFFLSAPALGFSPKWPMLWAVLLLLQMRLTDDWLARHDDRRMRQDRRPNPENLGGFACLLVFVNALPLLALNLTAAASYALFLVLQWPRFPPPLKYGALAMLLDLSCLAPSSHVVLHGILVTLAAVAFEIGHDPMATPGLRFAYATALTALLAFLPSINATAATLSLMFISISLLRLWPATERTGPRRWLYSGAAHIGAAMIASAHFKPSIF